MSSEKKQVEIAQKLEVTAQVEIPFGKVIIGAALIAGFIYFTNSPKNENEGLTNSYADVIMERVEKAFDEAELEILDTKPNPDDKPVGPDPDPKKCICQGTGKIIQGDGHVSKCPYHGSEGQPASCDCGCNKTGCECTGGCMLPQATQPSRNYVVPPRRGVFGGRLFGR